MLTLPIKKKWYNMILSGEKKEEYREIKPYYTTRFHNLFHFDPFTDKPFETVIHEICFRNGYSERSPFFIAECTLRIGTGKQKWGAIPNYEYYILQIKQIKKGA